ncbi:MAG: signal peptidase II [Gemmatimonadaceae bacterium]
MGRSEPGGLSRARVLAVVAGIIALDVVTKLVAVDRLAPMHVPHRVLGETLRLTLVYNPGAAFGLHLGAWSRPAFIVLTFVALGVVWSLYRSSAPTARLRVLALAAVAGGAIGNLIDRVRSARGVVDFVDIGVGSWRWPTFNVADSAVTLGALTLAVVLWREDAVAARRAQGAERAPPS